MVFRMRGLNAHKRLSGLLLGFASISPLQILESDASLQPADPHWHCEVLRDYDAQEFDFLVGNMVKLPTYLTIDIAPYLSGELKLTSGCICVF